LADEKVEIVGTRQKAALVLFFDNVDQACEAGSMLAALMANGQKALEEFTLGELVVALRDAESWMIWQNESP